MTLRVPKWLLWLVVCAAAAAAIAAAFALGRSSGASDSDTAEDRTPPCSKTAAEKATLASSFDETIRANDEAQARLANYSSAFGPDFFTDVATDYQVALLHCSDVTGDGSPEMIAGIGAGASRRVFSWAIFTPGEDGGWTLAFVRVGSQISTVKPGARSVVVRTPTFGKEDPLCCPSGFKAMQVDFRDGEFQASSSRALPADRRITVLDGRVTQLGPLDPWRDTPIQAVAELGAPTSIVGGSDTVCDYAWSDLGLSITFANFGGYGDVCGVDGRIASFELTGTPAAQAGWRTNEGAKVGMSVGTLQRLYPGARESGRELILIETPSPIGAGGTVAVMTAFAGGGKAWAFRFYVGAAGE